MSFSSNANRVEAVWAKLRRALAFLYFLAWICGGGFASYMARDRKVASGIYGILALWPIAGFWVVANYGHSNPVSVSEALIGVLLISFVAGGLIAAFAGIGLANFWHYDQDTRVHAGIAAAAASLLTVPIFAYYRAPNGWESSFQDFPFVALAQGLLGGCLYCVFPLRDPKPQRVTRIGLTIFALTFLLAMYCYPDVAFRMYRRESAMNWLEKIGAKRAAGSERSANQGQRALAGSGDEKAVEELIDRISRADIVGRENEMVVLSVKRSTDPRLRTALVAGLKIAVPRYKDDNTFDETDRAIEAYCESLTQCVDPRAVPDLIKAYNLTQTQMNIRLSAARALGNGFYKEAEPFIIEEFGRLHPIRDAATGKALAGSHTGDVAEAYDAFKAAGAAGKARLRDREVPFSELLRRDDIDAIVTRALSDDPGADQATIELIKRKHPRRFAAAEKHAGRRVFGNVLTTFRDPELYQFLSKRDLMAMENRRITRFICEWAPPESCALLGRLLKTDFALSATVGLSRCRNSNSPGYLFTRLKACRSGDGAPAFYLVRALGLMAYDPAAKEMGIWASGSRSAGAMNVSGKPVLIEDVARWALSRMTSPEARVLSRKYPPRDTSWVTTWPWR